MTEFQKPENTRPGSVSADIDEPVYATLDCLRKQIDSIDQEFVNILVKRRKVIDQVTELKKAHQLPVYHPAREEDLISRRRRQAEDNQLDPDHIEELFRCILRQSRASQAAHLTRKGIRAGSAVLIVGGKGSMGSYFRRWFTESGYRVRILDKDDWNEADDLCRDIKLAIISVPIDVTASVIETLCLHLPPDCVLADITSIKEPVMDIMLKAHRGPVIGLHPLFGPTTSTLDKQIVVATPGRNPQAYQWVLDQFSAWGSIILQADAQEHDEMMAIVQALRHFATFAFGRFLYHKQISLPRILEFSSPIYRLEMAMVGRLFAQDPSLYAEIIFASPERRKLLKNYVQSLSDTCDMIEKGDKPLFCDEFNIISEWFGPFSGQSIRESSFLIDKLIERF